MIPASLHGWLILDKPVGLTSTQAIGKARRLLGGTKVGHGGTLDPLATGILPLAFGEATKLIPYVMDGDKVYEFTVRWGEQRTTDDAEGDVIATSTVRPTPQAITAALPSFRGTILQTPPAFSAIKIQGERAYDIARSGGAPEIAPRNVTIFQFEYVKSPDTDRAQFRVTCGKGTYIRSLARDLAQALGTCGYVAALRRTQVGSFALDCAVTLKTLEDLNVSGTAVSALLPLQAVLGNLPVLNLNAAEAQRLRSGQGILIRPQLLHFMDQPLIFSEHQDTPVALVEPKAGEFRVVRGFHF
jgi:tRNA pseudouridine55 synthase